MDTLDFFQADRNAIRPLDLPQVRPQAVTRNCRLARARMPFALTQGVDCVLVPDGAPDWEGAGQPVDIAFTIRGQLGYLTTVMPVVQALLDRADIRLRPDQLDAELAAMLIETVLSERIEALEREVGGDIALLNLDRETERASMATLSFEILMTDIGIVYPGMIHASAPLLSHLARLWERQPPLPRDHGDLCLTVACRVGFTDLSPGALKALGVGDAMMFDRVAVQGGALVVIAEALHATAQFDEQGYLTLSEPFRPPERYALGDFLMSENDDSDRPVQAITDSDINDLPVRLVFEVGRKDLALEELRSMGVGGLVPLDRPASSAVQIFANGRRIGAGEMVMIGEQLGVRVTQLNGNA